MTAPIAEGQVLAGKYRVERVLGKGGMGVVVAARDIALERRVAIKFLLPQYSDHKDAATRFMREARAAVRIQSEHIARVIDVGSMENGSPYMVMEFLKGGDLSQIIEQRKQLPVSDAVLYVLQACDAIAEAHSYGIVHRDLKPANLFLANQPDGSDKVKVLDFGISKSTVVGPGSSDVSLTRTSSMMGSPLYMSPEQIRSTKDVDARTDIWALGVILYELLTGDLPFVADSIPELSAQILLEQPEPILRTDVPDGLKNAILHALQKTPQQRYPSVAEYAMAIAEYAPRRARQNVERISRLLVAAGMSDARLNPPTSLPPAIELEDTHIEMNLPQASTIREPSVTVADWSNTQGPKKENSGSAKWALFGALSALLLFSGVAAALLRDAKQNSKATDTTPVVAATTAEPVQQMGSAAVQALAPSLPEPVPSQNFSHPAASASTVHKVVAPAPQKLRKRRPKPASSKPKSTISTPIVEKKQAPPPNPTKKPSLKDKWGSRK